jgi:hypothetical protein
MTLDLLEEHIRTSKDEDKLMVELKKQVNDLE